MKPTVLLLAVLMLTPVAPAIANTGEHDLGLECCDPPVQWSARHDVAAARFAVTSVDGDVTLLLTDEIVAFQLSDRTYRKVRRELRQEMDDDEDNMLGQAIKSAVITTVRALLAHSAECPLDELHDVQYRDGRLVFIGERDRPVFARLRINDHEQLDGFTERDAQAFVREFRRVKGRSR